MGRFPNPHAHEPSPLPRAGGHAGGGGHRADFRQDRLEGSTPEQQVTAFEEFVQFDRVGAAGRVRGPGLGMTIVQRGARLLGHPPSLRWERGRGSCFTLEMPAGKEPASRPRPLRAKDLPSRW
jgi:hypothetical protein